MPEYLVKNFILTCIIVSLAGINTAKNHGLQKRYCKTSGCIKTARSIMENMDPTVNPCDNFYRFACGDYIKDSDIPEDLVSASIFGEADERLSEQLKESIENKIDDNDSRTFHLLKSHYNSCLYMEKTERTSMKMLLDVLDQLGGWPVISGESWNVSKFEWKSLIYKLRRTGYQDSINSFVSFLMGIDEKNNTKYVIELDQAETGILHKYLMEGVENVVVQAYYKYMVNIANALGVSKERAKKELAASLHFELELAKISLPVEGQRNMSQLYNPMTLDEIELKYPDIAWKEYINEILHPYYTVQSNEQVIVKNQEYMKSLSKLISKTPKRTLANYLIWRVVQESVSYLNEKFLKIQSEFDEDVLGTSGQLPRSRICVEHLSNNVPLALGALYVQKVFDKNFKKEGKELVENLRQSFQHSLEKVSWMDGKTKKAALRKLKSIYAHVAYPDELLDNEKLDKYFENLKQVPDSYLDSYLSLNLFSTNAAFQLLSQPVNKTEWTTHGESAVVNAYYQLTENSLQIPAGFFQKELFALDRPNYMNYGGLGNFIGHEFTHAFDDQGSQYDENGNLVDWWDSKTQKEYQKRAQCIVDQYSNYVVPEVGVNINGVNTQGENIADNGGLKQAYLAYQEYERQNGPEPLLPGLSYSPQQLFWLSFANIYCEINRPEALEYEIMSDEHCPGEYRVIGVLSNLPEFSKDFKCPLGSFMNPVNKCTVW